MLETTSRPLPGPTVDEVRALAAAAQTADGVEPLGEQTLLDLTSPGAVHVLAREAGGLVGYGHLGPVAPTTAEDPAPSAHPRGQARTATARTAELVVAPHARGAGLGRRILAALQAAAAPDAVAVWAHGSLPAALHLAQAAGLAPVRELWRMELPLTGRRGASDVALPAGVTVRAFAPGDEVAWLVANAAAFAHHPEQGRMMLADLQARMAEPWFRAEDLLLAESDGGLVGFAWLKVEPPVGELYALGVVPRAQGSGLGRALTALTIHRLAALRDGRVVERVVLFVDADNLPAVRTYTSAGFTVVRRDTQLGSPAA